ncbi:MAG: TraB/GumN family protein [Deltaproteobacteria bacterium]|nr:MAG: TraB/GumN family protein [Deltaproteobacteria bacterium]
MEEPASPPLPDSVTVLRDGERTIYLVGTAHVSRRSVEEVRSVIEAVRPDTVCVELCEPRYQALTQSSAWRDLDLFQVIREGKTLFLLANIALGAWQRRVGKALGVRPGEELLAATEAARALGAHLELIDRNVHVTLKRTWANLPFLTKLSLLGAVLESLFPARNGKEIEEADVEALKEQANLAEMLAAFAREVPGVKEPLIDERDRYMMRRIEEAPGKVIVAVVGAAHVPGMVAHFHEPTDLAALETVPPPPRWRAAAKWALPAAVIAAFAWGYHHHEGQTLGEMLRAWILPNSLFAALFTALAGGKLPSIALAFVVSPITSLNPLLGAGMVVGLLEAWLRRPTVQDLEAIGEDAQSLRGLYRNQATRVLLVAVASTLGSALGAWVGLGWLLTLVGG